MTNEREPGCPLCRLPVENIVEHSNGTRNITYECGTIRSASGKQYQSQRCVVRERDRLEAKVDELEAELSRLRSRLGADDDAEPLTYAWLDANFGEWWERSGANGMRLEIFNEGISEAEPRYEVKISCKTRTINVTTRGDVRSLVAALKPADAGGEQ